MVRNRYDAPAKTGGRAVQFVIMGVAAVTLIGGVLFALGQQRMAAVERWTPQGPECPVWAGPLPVSKSRPDLQSFDYAGVTLGRWFGHASCVELHKTFLPGGGVFQACHFTGPDFVRVKAGGVETTYRPGVGKPTIITIRDGVATCATDPRGTAPANP